MCSPIARKEAERTRTVFEATRRRSSRSTTLSSTLDLRSSPKSSLSIRALPLGICS